MNTSLEISIRSSLPAIPRQLHPVISAGVVEEKLLPACRHHTPAQLMQEFLDRHRSENARFRACYWMEPLKRDANRAAVRFIPRFDRCKHQPLGVTINDPLAARFLIANARPGAWMPGIRWELYADPHMEELLGMGCFHQWDLLGDVTGQDLKRLADAGVAPAGNWDFLQIIWHNHCSVCGSPVGVNIYACDIDSAVCSRCGNRPYLAPFLHRSLKAAVEMDWPEHLRKLSDHVVQWLARLEAPFKDVRRDAEDADGELLRSVVGQYSLVARMVNPRIAESLRPLLEKHGVDFDLYRAGCVALYKALSSETPFREEHRLTLQFLEGMTHLIEQRQLKTN